MLDRITLWSQDSVGSQNRISYPLTADDALDRHHHQHQLTNRTVVEHRRQRGNLQRGNLQNNSPQHGPNNHGPQGRATTHNECAATRQTPNSKSRPSVVEEGHRLWYNHLKTLDVVEHHLGPLDCKTGQDSTSNTVCKT